MVSPHTVVLTVKPKSQRYKTISRQSERVPFILWRRWGASFANAFSSSPFQDFCGLVHYSMLLFGFLPVTWSSAGRRESCLSYSLLFFFSILQDKKMDSSHPFAVECRGCMSAFIRNLPIFRLLLFLSSLAVILRVSDCEISREPTTQPIDFLYDVRH